MFFNFESPLFSDMSLTFPWWNKFDFYDDFAYIKDMNESTTESWDSTSSSKTIEEVKSNLVEDVDNLLQKCK